MHSKKKSARIRGFDFARGIAVFGMFFMNFKIVMAPPLQKPEGFWPLFLQAWEGRFGSLFVILAGIGISLLTRRARMENNRGLMKKNKKILFYRAIFLWVTGLLFIPVWPADILHYYGIYIGLALLVLRWSNRHLVTLMVCVTLVFVPLFLVVDWAAYWDWSSLTYKDFWTVKGFLMNTFFNGFHPVFPWFAFLLFGILVGRVNLADRNVQTICLKIAGIVFTGCEILTYAVFPYTAPNQMLFALNTLSFPPFPLFIISGASSSLIIVVLSLIICEKLGDTFIHPIVSTGQMVLTHYIGHVVIAMGMLETIGKLYNQTLLTAFGVTVGYFLISVLFSVLWQKKFSKGPIETIMRKITG